MTAGNGVRATTPFLPSDQTGGPDPSAGKGWDPSGESGVLAWPAVGGELNPETNDMGRYGYRPANLSMQIPEGPPGDGENSLTFGLANADCSGDMSMQDMTGPKEAGSPKALNTNMDDLRPYASHVGHFDPVGVGTPMDQWSNMNGFYGVRANGSPMNQYADVDSRI